MLSKIFRLLAIMLVAWPAFAQQQIQLGPDTPIQVKGVLQPANQYVYVGALSGLPSTCSIGQLAFVTGVSPGQNDYRCTATNVWTLQGNQSVNGLGNGTTVIDVTTQPYNADPSGIIDSTAAIQAAINLFSSGRAATASGSILFPPGEYKIISPLYYIGANGYAITFVGNANGLLDQGSTLFWAGSTGQTMFEMMAASQFIFRNIAFDLNSSARIGLHVAADNAISTTLGTSVSTGSQTFTPGSITNLGIGTLVTVDSGANTELVYITNISGSNATATFTNPHAGSALVGGTAASYSGVIDHVATINVPTSATDWATLPGSATAGILLGNVMPSATSEVSEISLISPQVRCSGSSAGVAIIGAGNVKNFFFSDATISGCQYGIDQADSGSGTLKVSGGAFANNTVADFRVSPSSGVISSVEVESATGHRFLTASGGSATNRSMVLEGNSFQSQAPSDDYIIVWPWAIVMSGNTFYNMRTGSSIAKLQTGAPLFTSNSSTSITSVGNWFQNAANWAPFYDGSNNALLPSYYNNQPVNVTSFGDMGGIGSTTTTKLGNYGVATALVSQSPAFVAASGVLRAGDTDTAVAFRNHANSGDVLGLSKDTSDVVHIGGTAGVALQGPLTGVVYGNINTGRVYFGNQTTNVAGNFLLTNWGGSPTVTVANHSKDQAGIITFTTGTPSANPTVTLTFADGTFTNAPFCIATYGGNGSTQIASSSPGATSVVFGFAGTPATSTAYTLTWYCLSGQ